MLLKELMAQSNSHRLCEKISKMINFGRDLSKLSTDPRIQVACVIFPMDCSAVYSIGYNGVARGLPHVYPTTEPGSGSSGAAHAEANALVKLNPMIIKDCILYTTYMPCSYCAPLIINCPIIRTVLADNRYDNDSGSQMLKDAALEVYHAQDIIEGQLCS